MAVTSETTHRTGPGRSDQDDAPGHRATTQGPHAQGPSAQASAAPPASGPAPPTADRSTGAAAPTTHPPTDPSAPASRCASRPDPVADSPLSPTARLQLSGIRPPLQSRMHHYYEASADRTPDHVALEWEGGQLSYAELDAEANAFAHHLRARGARDGGRIGLLLPRSRDLYVALLGIMKAGSAFVPIDPASPADRVGFIATDSDLDLLVSGTALAPVHTEVPAPVVLVDDEETVRAVAAAPRTRPLPEELDDPTAYIIYTSGSTGRPKGVDVAQHSICSFVHVISEVYDVRPEDRVYQGMTIAFDFAIEEVWPTWAMGATLVAGPTDARRVGSGLTDFLEERVITLLYCVPTVLSTMDRTLPGIRALMVGGEACPAELVERWAPGRRMLNTYGPTEATVTCVWSVLVPGRPGTIGIPVPTYTAAILDEARRPVPEGEVGELCIGGPGVARGGGRRRPCRRSRGRGGSRGARRHRGLCGAQLGRARAQRLEGRRHRRHPLQVGGGDHLHDAARGRGDGDYHDVGVRNRRQDEPGHQGDTETGGDQAQHGHVVLRLEGHVGVEARLVGEQQQVAAAAGAARDPPVARQRRQVHLVIPGQLVVAGQDQHDRVGEDVADDQAVQVVLAPARVDALVGEGDSEVDHAGP